MAVQRLQIAKNKMSSFSKHQKREIAQLLGKGKEEMARIKVEHIIREDFTIECYEILELYCELLHERIRVITNSVECPVDLREAVSSLMWAATQVQIDELVEVRKQLEKKFGEEFVNDAIRNEYINQRLLRKLAVTPPSALLVFRYLEEIAKEYNVDYTPSDIGLPNNIDAPIPTPIGFSIPMAPASSLSMAYEVPQCQSVNVSQKAEVYVPEPPAISPQVPPEPSILSPPTFIDNSFPTCSTAPMSDCPSQYVTAFDLPPANPSTAAHSESTASIPVASPVVPAVDPKFDELQERLNALRK